MAAIYQADIWCNECVDNIKWLLAAEIWFDHSELPDSTSCDCFNNVDDLADYLAYMPESSYDSDDWPKWCSDGAEADSPQHCAAGADCVDCIELPDGEDIGYCFGNALTAYGEDYVKEAVHNGEDGGVAREVWAVEYDYLDFEEVDEYVS